MQYNYVEFTDCFEGVKKLQDGSVQLIMTSPPYGMQRKYQYGGVNERDYPQWTVKWCDTFRKKLKENGSICINIRAPIKNGELSDMVLKTRLAMRYSGWIECEEIIWYKTDSPPMGSINRPRRAWESILWFSTSRKPKCNTKANGKKSARMGLEQTKFEEGGKSNIHAGQNKAEIGMARSKDVIVCSTSKVERGYIHPAMYPIEVPEYIIKLLTDRGDLVVDPFCGSGTTCRAAEKNGRAWIGFEINKKYKIDWECWRDKQMVL